MLNLAKELKIEIEDAIEKAFSSEILKLNNAEINLDPQLVRASKADFGDYQINCALGLAKPLKESPRKIALMIIEQLNKNDTFLKLCNPPEIAGPGFINLRLKEEVLKKEIKGLINDKRLGVPKVDKLNDMSIVIDFSSPNIAKEMHVGHLRSTIIGDSISRILEFRGYKTIRLNHVGDWGTQFGMLISQLKSVVPDALTEDNKIDLSDLVSFYRDAKKRFDQDMDFQKDAREEVIKLQKGEPMSLKAWKWLCNQSRNEFNNIYDRLDIEISERGESFYNPYLPGIIDELDSLGLLVTDNGAKCIFLEGSIGKDGKPLPVIIQKSDGGFNYTTTDLAAIKYRFSNPPKGDGAYKIIYVTDAGQANHFESIFQIAKLANWIPANASLLHISFGLVQGIDGKKLKTRSGETVKLKDLLDESINKAYENLSLRLKEEKRVESEEFMKEVSEAVGIAAVKYADLSQNRISNYQFSFEKMLTLQGNTAPYLLYALVRISGISRKGGDFRHSLHELSYESPQEWALIKELLKFDEVIIEVEKEFLPNRLCNYLFELSQNFNRFYDQVPILKSNEPSRSSRIALCQITANTLKLGMQLLGIKTLERM